MALIVGVIVGASTLALSVILVVGCALWAAVLYEPRRPGGGPPPDVPS